MRKAQTQVHEGGRRRNDRGRCKTWMVQSRQVLHWACGCIWCAKEGHGAYSVVHVAHVTSWKMPVFRLGQAIFIGVYVVGMVSSVTTESPMETGLS